MLKGGYGSANRKYQALTRTDQNPTPITKRNEELPRAANSSQWERH